MRCFWGCHCATRGAEFALVPALSVYISPNTSADFHIHSFTGCYNLAPRGQACEVVAVAALSFVAPMATEVERLRNAI